MHKRRKFHLRDTFCFLRKSSSLLIAILLLAKDGKKLVKDWKLNSHELASIFVCELPFDNFCNLTGELMWNIKAFSILFPLLAFPQGIEKSLLQAPLSIETFFDGGTDLERYTLFPNLLSRIGICSITMPVKHKITERWNICSFFIKIAFRTPDFSSTLYTSTSDLKIFSLLWNRIINKKNTIV